MWLLQQAVPTGGWVGPTIALSLVIIALSFLLDRLGVRAGGAAGCARDAAAVPRDGIAAHRAGPGAGRDRRRRRRGPARWPGSSRDEAEALVGASRALREGLHAARLQNLEAIYDVVEEEVTETALDLAVTLRRSARGPAGSAGSAGCWAATGAAVEHAPGAAALAGRAGPGALPRPTASLDPGHPHLPRRIGPGQSRRCSPPPSPTCCAPFPSIFCTATSPPTAPSPRSTPRSAGTATTGRWARRSSPRRGPTPCAPLASATSRHLAADTVAHNFYVPRQLVLTSSTTGFGHSYWESRLETHLGDRFAHTAKEVILLDHTPADTLLDGSWPRRSSA